MTLYKETTQQLEQMFRIRDPHRFGSSGFGSAIDNADPDPDPGAMKLTKINKST
jgi:hypothetical protein